MVAEISPAYLSGLSKLAGRSFDSVEEAAQALLQLISERLGMRSAFLTRITPETNRNEVLAPHNAPDGCGIPPGRCSRCREPSEARSPARSSRPRCSSRTSGPIPSSPSMPRRSCRPTPAALSARR